MRHTEEQKASAEKRERDNIRTRNGSLVFLALGTAIASMMIGKTIATQFELNILASGFIQIVCIIFGYISIDAGVRNNLTAASDANEDKTLKSYFSKKSIYSLLFTVLFSFGANYFVGQFVKGESNYKKFNEQIELFSKRDSTNKALAAQTLNTLTGEQKEALELARKKAKQLEADVVAKGTAHWRRDYKAAKDNPAHWLWVCTGKKSGCPLPYRNWRDEILAARQEGQRLIADVAGANIELKKALSQTFTYNLQRDTTLSSYQGYIEQMETERNAKGLLITGLLILITFISAFNAFDANKSVNKIRGVYGQQVAESEQLLFEILEDFCLRVAAQFFGIVAGVLIFIDKMLEKIGIDLYEIESRQIAKVKRAITGKAPAPNADPVRHDELRTPREVEAVAQMAAKKELEKAETPPLPQPAEKRRTYVGKDFYDSTPPVEKSIVENSTHVVEEPEAVINNNVEPTINLNITKVTQGLKYVLWNGKKRDEGWIRKQLAAYIATKNKRIREGKTTTTQDERIRQLSEALTKLTTP